MNIKKSLFALRNIVVTINTIMWIEWIRWATNDNTVKANKYVDNETTVAGLLLQILIFLFTPVAAIAKIVAIFCALLYKFGSCKLTA